jgi:hypothetical protein
MVWTEQKDLSLLKEIAAEGVLTTKENLERGGQDGKLCQRIFVQFSRLT